MSTDSKVASFVAACYDAQACQQQALRKIFALNGPCLQRRGGAAAAAAAAEADEHTDVDALLRALPLTSYTEYKPAAEAAVEVGAPWSRAAAVARGFAPPLEQLRGQSIFCP